MASIELDILANIQQATASVNKFSKETTSSLQNIEKGFSALGAVAAAALAYVASDKIISFMKEAAHQASEQQDAILSLNLALASVGTYSDAASESIQKFASKMQDSVGIADDVIIKQVGLARTYAHSNEEAEKLTKAAIELSAATGMNLNSSVEALGKSLQGMDGALGRSIPTAKGFTEYQLKAGAAIDYVLKRFGGIAEAKIDTYSGQLKIAGLAWDDFNKAIGSAIIENPLIIKVISETSKIIKNLTKVVDENKDKIIEWMNKAIRFFISAIPPLITVFETIIAFIESLVNGFIFLGTTIYNISVAIAGFKDMLIGGFKTALYGIYDAILYSIKGILSLVDSIPGASEALGAFGIDTKEVMSNIDDKINETTNNFVKQWDDTVEKVNLKNPFEEIQKSDDMFSGIYKGLKIVKTEAQELSDTVEKMGDKWADNTKKVVKEINEQAEVAKLKADEIRKYISEGVSTPFLTQNQLNKFGARPVEFNEGSMNPGYIGQGAGLLQSMLKGAEGASSAISSTLGMVADTFLPGIGGAVGDIVKVLAQGPDAVRNMITSFLDSLPVLLENIVKSIPVVIETLAEKLPEIIEKIADKADVIVEALVNKMPNVALALAKATLITIPLALTKAALVFIEKIAEAALMWTVKIMEGILAISLVLAILPVAVIAALAAAAVVFIAKILEGLPQFIKGIVDGATQFITQVVNGASQFINAIMSKIQELIKPIIDALSSVLSGLINGAGSFIQALVDQAGVFVTAIADKFAAAGNAIIEGIKNALSSLFGIGGGKGGANQPVGNLTNNDTANTIVNAVVDTFTNPLGATASYAETLSNVFGFHAKGGLIPQGYPNDSYSAKLTSGELVIPKDDVINLRNFLSDQKTGSQNQVSSNQDNSKPTIVNLMIGEKELASVLLNLNRRGFRTA